MSVYLEDKNQQRFTDLWFLTNTWSDQEKWSQGSAKISIENPSDDLEYRIVVAVSKGRNKKSYVAVDQFEFLQTDACELHPPEATTPVPVTTAEPTEPPGRKFFNMYLV